MQRGKFKHVVWYCPECNEEFETLQLYFDSSVHSCRSKGSIVSTGPIARVKRS